MPSTYLDLTCHVVFSTKHRQPWIDELWRQDLHAYLGGIVRGLGAVPLAIGGVEDHVHLLIGLRGNHALGDVVREIKKASHAWVEQTVRLRPFAWQEGYAGFSVSSDRKSTIVNYIANQEGHHKKITSLDELKGLLDEAGIVFNAAYLE
jgi:putative transposase